MTLENLLKIGQLKPHEPGAEEIQRLLQAARRNLSDARTEQVSYRCEFCEGTVKPRRVERESFKHKKGFIILENVTIGVCDRCGNRYYSADILQAVDDLATGKRTPERTEAIPVAHLDPA